MIEEVTNADSPVDQHIKTYLTGWERGDGALSLTATAASFHYDDPNTGRIEPEDFVDFVNDFKQAAIDMGADPNAQPFLLYSDTIIEHQTEQSTIWCWWQANGTELQGAAVIKASSEGILHEKIAYFSKLPE